MLILWGKKQLKNKIIYPIWESEAMLRYEADPELAPGKEEKKRKPRTPRKEMFKGLPVRSVP